DLRLLREHLADPHARDVGADRPPEPAVLGRGVGLQVVEVHVARAAVEPDQDDARVLRRVAGAGRRLLEAQEAGKAERGEPGDAELHEAATGDAGVLEGAGAAVDSEHRALLPGPRRPPRRRPAPTPAPLLILCSPPGAGVGEFGIWVPFLPLWAPPWWNR